MKYASKALFNVVWNNNQGRENCSFIMLLKSEQQLLSPGKMLPPVCEGYELHFYLHEVNGCSPVFLCSSRKAEKPLYQPCK